MASYFLDSSAVVKFYHPEVGSATVQRVFSEADTRILISRLAVVEVWSAFAGKLSIGAITEREARLSLDRFKSDLVAGVMAVFALKEFHYRRAEHLRNEPGTTTTPDARLPPTGRCARSTWARLNRKICYG